MLYLKHVEKLRSDIKMKDSAGLLFNDAFTDKPGQAVYYAEVIDDNKDREPMGFVYKTVKKNEEFSSSPLWMDNYIKRGLEDNTVFKDYWTRGITARYPLALAIFHFRKGNQEAGIKQLEKAFSIASDIPWLVKNIGFIYYSEGLFEYAARVYKRLIEIDRSDITAYKSLASCYEKMGMQNEPVNVYKACQKVVPTAEVASILAALYEKQGNDDEAIKNYKTAISRKTDYFEAYNNLGAIYKKKGNTEEAVKQFSRAIKINPSYVEARYNLAMSYMEIDYKKAINEFNEVLRIMPDFMDVHYNLGVLYGKTGQVEKAIEEYEEELKINPSSASACKNLGIFYHDAGQNKKTVYYWKKYLQLNPSAPDAALIEAEIYKME
jgi:tetratricopeptide (TPR) repeat protein